LAIAFIVMPSATPLGLTVIVNCADVIALWFASAAFVAVTVMVPAPFIVTQPLLSTVAAVPVPVNVTRPVPLPPVVASLNAASPKVFVPGFVITRRFALPL